MSVVSLLLAVAPSYGQLPLRTWISGVGDDSNPGSRTAPGKTFGAMLAKTADGGEIDALDPVDFGGLSIQSPDTNISKGITINGGAGVAGVVISSPNQADGITIVVSGNFPMTVTLKNLDIYNTGIGGRYGIIALGPITIHIENCRIHGFNSDGIYFLPVYTGSKLFVSNTLIYNNGGSGIDLIAGAYPAMAYIQNSSINHCGGGVIANPYPDSLNQWSVVVRNTKIDGNSGVAVQAVQGALVAIENGSVSWNAIGIKAFGYQNIYGKITTPGTVVLSDVAIEDNLTTNILRQSGGVIDSFHDNAELGVGGPATGGKPTNYLREQ
jgi:hypothetical protein